MRWDGGTCKEHRRIFRMCTHEEKADSGSESSRLFHPGICSQARCRTPISTTARAGPSPAQPSPAEHPARAPDREAEAEDALLTKRRATSPAYLPAPAERGSWSLVAVSVVFVISVSVSSYVRSSSLQPLETLCRPLARSSCDSRQFLVRSIPSDAPATALSSAFRRPSGSSPPSLSGTPLLHSVTELLILFTVAGFGTHASRREIRGRRLYLESLERVKRLQRFSWCGIRGWLRVCCRRDEEARGLKMIKLFSVKQKQKEDAQNNNGRPIKKQSAGELRAQKDISELNLAKTIAIHFPNGKDNLLSFEITIRPDEGYYQGGTFVFSFSISQVYPHEAPKVKCKTKVYHPNIDLEGNVCLNILREDWKPVLSINSIIYGLQYLFLDPNPDDPLNHEAAEVLRDNPRQFEQSVRRSMAGGYVGGTHFPRCI